MVEFTLVAPLLFALLLGIVDFGINLSNQIAANQGVREAARQASVANFGPTASCGATLATAGSANMRKLICLAKARSDVTAVNPSVAIRFDPNANAYPAGGEAQVPPVGNGIIVCQATPLRSISGLFGPVLSGSYIRSKAVMRIEKGSGVAEAQANEADPTGQNWAWCTP